MADRMEVPDNLKGRFGQFDSIVEVTKRLQGRIEQINEANKVAGGKDDATAKAYHKQVDKPTENLDLLVGNIATLFGVTGTRGGAAADTLDEAGEEAGEHALTWQDLNDDIK